MTENFTEQVYRLMKNTNMKNEQRLLSLNADNKLVLGMHVRFSKAYIKYTFSFIARRHAHMWYAAYEQNTLQKNQLCSLYFLTTTTEQKI